MASYDVGDVARLKVTFTKIKNGQKSKADPTTVKVKIRDPLNKLTEYVYVTDVEVVRDNIGEYHVDVPTNVVGEWWHRWIGTGAVVTADEEKFTVERSVFADPT